MLPPRLICRLVPAPLVVVISAALITGAPAMILKP